MPASCTYVLHDGSSMLVGMHKGRAFYVEDQKLMTNNVIPSDCSLERPIRWKPRSWPDVINK